MQDAVELRRTQSKSSKMADKYLSLREEERCNEEVIDFDSDLDLDLD